MPVDALRAVASSESCAHGARRRTSRSKASRELTVAWLSSALVGRTWNSVEAKALLDPTSCASRGPGEADQPDPVELTHVLRQVLVHKWRSGRAGAGRHLDEHDPPADGRPGAR